MKITTYASAAAIVFAMSLGTVSAEEQNAVTSDTVLKAPLASTEQPLSLLNDTPLAIPMTSEQLRETMGAGEENGRRRWFHRRKMVICCDNPT